MGHQRRLAASGGASHRRRLAAKQRAAAEAPLLLGVMAPWCHHEVPVALMQVGVGAGVEGGQSP